MEVTNQKIMLLAGK